MKFFIQGQVISQKNSKTIGYNRATGRRFIMSTKNVHDWQKKAGKQIKTVPKVKGQVSINMTFINKDRIRRDLDNMLTSVLDLLKNYEIIEDDNCFTVVQITATMGGISKENAGVWVEIIEKE